MAVLSYTTLGGILAGAPNVASDVTTAFTQAQTSINNVQDDQYVNKNNQVWRAVLQTPCYIGGGLTAGTYWIPGSGATTNPVASGVSVSGNGAVAFIPATAADYAVTGKTTTYRLSTLMSSGATTLGTTATFGVYPVTALTNTGVGQLGWTLGAVVAGSTAAQTSTASSMTQVTSSTFTLSSSTNYVIGVAIAGTVSAMHVSASTLILQMSHV